MLGHAYALFGVMTGIWLPLLAHASTARAGTHHAGDRCAGRYLHEGLLGSGTERGRGLVAPTGSPPASARSAFTLPSGLPSRKTRTVNSLPRFLTRAASASRMSPGSCGSLRTSMVPCIWAGSSGLRMTAAVLPLWVTTTRAGWCSTRSITSEGWSRTSRRIEVHLGTIVALQGLSYPAIQRATSPMGPWDLAAINPGSSMTLDRRRAPGFSNSRIQEGAAMTNFRHRRARQSTADVGMQCSMTAQRPAQRFTPTRLR